MHINSDKDIIIVNSSHLPIIRVGYSNIIFFLLAIALIFVNQILIEINSSVYIKFLILLAISSMTFKVYTHSVSRLYIKDNKSLVFVGPISKSIIDASKIRMTKVYGIPSSMTIFILIKKRGTAIPVFHFFIAVSTNYGSYLDAKRKLIALLQKLEPTIK
jgi:hypothetical protein